MAAIDLNSAYGFVDARVARGINGSSILAEQNNYDTLQDMRTRLTAINGTYYTAARLDTFTYNDLVYALRQASDSAGIR